jgi:hypothetical protein
LTAEARGRFGDSPAVKLTAESTARAAKFSLAAMKKVALAVLSFDESEAPVGDDGNNFSVHA